VAGDLALSELIVGRGIIAVLMAIILSVYANTRETA